MKYSIVGFLVAAALATSLPCQAGDRSTAKEKKTAKSSAPAKQPSAQSNQQPQVAQMNPRGTAFCHRGDQYCIRIAASPWWPNAPGD
ncbi:MAG TPA: hypothetical protein VNW72_00445 [Chthoniobacterales bacterium]|nr:hypothetical protein [Chthoniobacterales bacterium]